MFLAGKPLSPKLKLGYEGRRNWRQKISKFRTENPGKLVWFHCASLGEFEMARPVIEELHKNQPQPVKVLLTFFSPSGFEVRKSYDKVDGVFYLPLDTPKNAKDFVYILNPDIAVFLKYEFWLNYLSALKASPAKVFLVNGLFRKDQVFFKWWGSLFREALGNFDYFFLQTKDSQNLLKNIGIENSAVTGDLRYDRVVAIAEQAVKFEQLATFLNKHFVIIGGSTWAEEEWILQQCKEAMGDKVKIMVAPHNISTKNLEKIESQFSKLEIKRFSHMRATDNPDVVLVDTMGHLSSLYGMATVALVGGGFSGALHNIIEPAAFGIPVFFGYKHARFPEAAYFKKHRIGISIHNGFNFTEHIKELMAHPKKLETIKNKMPSVFKSHLGGTFQVYYKIVGSL